MASGQSQAPQLCQCGCGVTAFKVAHKTGHAVHCGEETWGAERACSTRVCSGRRAHRKGHRAQDAVLNAVTDAQGLPRGRTSNEETARTGKFHYEVKEGAQIPAGLRGPIVERWEAQARAATTDIPRQPWALVFVLPDGRKRVWMDLDDHLALLKEVVT